MVYDKIKYVFRKDGQSRKIWIDDCLKLYKDNPDSAELANVATRRNITIVSINNSGSYIRYSDAYNDSLALNMEYFGHTAVIMEDGTIFYDIGEYGENKVEMQKAFYDYVVNGVIPEWADTDTDYIELDDIVL